LADLVRPKADKVEALRSYWLASAVPRGAAVADIEAVVRTFAGGLITAAFAEKIVGGLPDIPLNDFLAGVRDRAEASQVTTTQQDQRVREILARGEAIGQSRMARRLASTTTMTVTEATAAMSTAPRERTRDEVLSLYCGAVAKGQRPDPQIERDLEQIQAEEREAERAAQVAPTPEQAQALASEIVVGFKPRGHRRHG
jgi:hypothetical protein